jgi:hypothetical protein
MQQRGQSTAKPRPVEIGNRQIETASLAGPIRIILLPTMEPENNSPARHYRWPWFVLAMVVLGLVLAVLWVALAARKIERQRDYNAPLPATTPAR